MSLAASPPSEGAGRLACTGYAVVRDLLFVPTVVLFVLEVTFLPLVLVTVGIPVLLLVVPATAGLAGLHRQIAGAILGERLHGSYRPTTGQGPLRTLRTWAGDPARWRDLLGLLTSMTVGYPLSVLTKALLLGSVFYLVYPFLWWVTPDGVFDLSLGVLTVDTLGETVLMWLPAAALFGLWWVLARPLMRSVARLDRAVFCRSRAEELQERVQVLAESRARSVDHSAAELRRIERDLHDGAQARLVALGMSLGMADDLFARDPEAARRMVAEARATTGAALGDLRDVVRGIHPPVLADRGLVGAVQALALDLPIPVRVDSRVTARPPAPVESAVYFAVAECLANVGKHAGAERAWVLLDHRDGLLTAVVGDDGRGVADPGAGTGMRGVVRRLSAFDGTMRVSSPAGGPTLVTLEVPCALSSPRTTPSSGTA